MKIKAEIKQKITDSKSCNEMQQQCLEASGNINIDNMIKFK